MPSANPSQYSDITVRGSRADITGVRYHFESLYISFYGGPRGLVHRPAPGLRLRHFRAFLSQSKKTVSCVCDL